jgi:hypothetical protein
MLDGQDPVHALEAQAALAIQEVRDMGLLESRLLCQTEAGQIAFINALPKSFAEVVLQHSEFHSWEYSIGAYSNTLTEKDFHSPFGITTLTEIIYLTQCASCATFFM